MTMFQNVTIDVSNRNFQYHVQESSYVPARHGIAYLPLRVYGRTHCILPSWTWIL